MIGEKTLYELIQEWERRETKSHIKWLKIISKLKFDKKSKKGRIITFNGFGSGVKK